MEIVDMKKKCHVCKKELTGLKTRFCGNVCYLNHKAESAKKHSASMRKKNPPKPCTVCGEEFHPLRADNTACSKVCSQEQAKIRQQRKRDQSRKLTPVKPMEKRKPIVVVKDHTKFERVKVAEFCRGDKTKKHVLAYLQTGGTILKFPDEPRAKIPEVNIPFGHTNDELMGFGLEFDHDEQIEIDAL